jgi:hypothetical protein
LSRSSFWSQMVPDISGQFTSYNLVKSHAEIWMEFCKQLSQYVGQGAMGPRS